MAEIVANLETGGAIFHEQQSAKYPQAITSRSNIAIPNIIKHDHNDSLVIQLLLQMECDTDKSVRKQEVGLQVPVEKRMKPSDFAEYDELVKQLADLLKITRHPDSSITIKAARLVIENLLPPSETLTGGSREIDSTVTNAATTSSRFTQQVVTETSTTKTDEKSHQRSKFYLNDIALPDSVTRRASDRFAMLKCSPITSSKADGESNTGGDDGFVAPEKDDLMEMFNRSAKALKLLYLDDQRQLQNQVNGIISSIQSITANPKTDHRLSATGR